jgi:hypothetical protein
LSKEEYYNICSIAVQKDINALNYIRGDEIIDDKFIASIKVYNMKTLLSIPEKYHKLFDIKKVCKGTDKECPIIMDVIGKDDEYYECDKKIHVYDKDAFDIYGKENGNALSCLVCNEPLNMFLVYVNK